MEINDLNLQSYNRIAEKFSFSRSYVWPDLQKFKTYVQEGNKVLDLGCGNGRLVELFKDLDVEYLGVDGSFGLINSAKKSFPDKNFQVMDALNLDLPENSYDVILCVSVLNHIAKENQQQFIDNLKKVLKPNGVLLLSNWSLWNIKGKKSVWHKVKDDKFPKAKFKDVWTLWKSTEVKEPLYYYAFTKREVTKLLNKNDFEIIEAYYSKKGQKTNILYGENIVTIARNKKTK